jgi:hypothetical protein
MVSLKATGSAVLPSKTRNAGDRARGRDPGELDLEQALLPVPGVPVRSQRAIAIDTTTGPDVGP